MIQFGYGTARRILMNDLKLKRTKEQINLSIARGPTTGEVNIIQLFRTSFNRLKIEALNIDGSGYKSRTRK